jgi:AcrR family transcriptional regulator
MKFDMRPIIMTEQEVLRRPYRQGARALAAEATGQRIVDAFLAHLRIAWFEEITLDAVAQDAGVTVQTIVRRFGSKQGLLEAVPERLQRDVLERRRLSVGDIGRTIDLLIADYEESGDLVMRFLAQEERHPALRELNDFGRAGHRQWLRASFAPWLDPLPAAECDRRLDMLVVATDVYAWKLVRRDMRRSVAALKAIILQLAEAALQIATMPTSKPAKPR